MMNARQDPPPLGQRIMRCPFGRQSLFNVTLNGFNTTMLSQTEAQSHEPAEEAKAYDEKKNQGAGISAKVPTSETGTRKERTFGGPPTIGENTLKTIMNRAKRCQNVMT